MQVRSAGLEKNFPVESRLEYDDNGDIIKIRKYLAGITYERTVTITNGFMECSNWNVV